MSNILLKKKFIIITKLEKYYQLPLFDECVFLYIVDMKKVGKNKKGKYNLLVHRNSVRFFYRFVIS